MDMSSLQRFMAFDPGTMLENNMATGMVPGANMPVGQPQIFPAQTGAPATNQPVGTPQPVSAQQPAPSQSPAQPNIPAVATPTNYFGQPFQFQDDRQREAMEGFFTSPDYQFRFGEGARALDASAASRGLLLSGNQLKDLTRFGQGLAAGEYGNYYNRLAGIAGLGQTPDFGGFAGMGSNIFGNLMGARGDLTANVGNIQGAGANAQAGLWGNVLGNMPWGQIGSAIGNVFGGSQNSSAPISVASRHNLANTPTTGFNIGGMF